MSDEAVRDCGGIMDGDEATCENLMAGGMTAGDAAKVLAFRDRLREVSPESARTVEDHLHDMSCEDLDIIADWEKLVTIVARARRVVDAQAEDDGLWFETTRASEAYLQQALRLLHAAFEYEGTLPESARVRYGNPLRIEQRPKAIRTGESPVNQRNVEALAVLLAKSPWEIELLDDDRRPVDEDKVTTTLAEWLASRGLLAPSARPMSDTGRMTGDDWLIALEYQMRLTRTESTWVAGEPFTYTQIKVWADEARKRQAGSAPPAERHPQ